MLDTNTALVLQAIKDLREDFNRGLSKLEEDYRERLAKLEVSQEKLEERITGGLRTIDVRVEALEQTRIKWAAYATSFVVAGLFIVDHFDILRDLFE